MALSSDLGASVLDLGHSFLACTSILRFRHWLPILAEGVAGELPSLCRHSHVALGGWADMLLCSAPEFSISFLKHQCFKFIVFCYALFFLRLLTVTIFGVGFL